MSALLEALQHPNNGPRPLTEALASLVNPSADLTGLSDAGGAVCDFRPGLEERNASLSIDRQTGGTVFNRFGHEGMGAVAFVMSCLGVGKGEAAKFLIDRAGIVDTLPAKGGTFTGGGLMPTAKAGAVKVLEAVSKWGPLSEEQRRDTLRGYVRLTGDGQGVEEQEVAGRRLTAALTSDLAVAYRFAGREHEDATKPGQIYRLPKQFTPHVLLLEIRGPDGQAWAYKGRNQGSKAALDAEQKNRYAYPKGSKAAAWCSSDLTSAPAELLIEGELNGVASAYMLTVAGHGAAVGVQGLAGATGKPHAAHWQAGRRIYVYADSDEAGDRARQTWAGIAHHMGAAVYQLPADLFGGGDACEALSSGEAEELGGKLWAAMQAAEQWQPPQEHAKSGGALEVWTSKKTGYKIDGGRLCAFTVKDEGEALEVLCDFSALITAEVTQEDGTGEAARIFEIEGQRPDGKPMYPPRVPVKAAEFNGMGWAVANWGAGAIVRAGSAKKDKAREAIQQLSAAAGIAQRTVYQFTGWLEHEEHGPLYLTAGAVIGKAGGVEGIDVELGGRLAGYSLPDPAKEEASAIRAAVRSSLALLDLAPDAVSVPVMGCIYRAALGRLNAVVWLTGETGRNKTTYLALAQSHYGKAWNAQHLPDGWNTTPNALEKSAFAVKDAPFLIDDFKPAGSKAEVDRAHGGVSRIVQGVADGAGRGRMDYRTGGNKAGLFPRGSVMSSAEQLPRGHSNRARAVLVDVHRPLIDSAAKSKAYHAAADLAGGGVYALALAAYVQTLAGNLNAVRVGSEAHKSRTRELAERFEGAHGRTGPAAAELGYGCEVFLAFAVEVGAVSQPEAAHLWGRVLSALEDTAAGQGEHLHGEDPVNRALSLLSGLLAQGRVYLEDLDGGVPVEPESAGWQRETFELHGSEGESFKPRPNAVLLGYVDKSGGDTWAYILPDALHEALQGVATRQGGAALPDAAGLWANMRDRFHPRGLMRCETEKTSGRVRPFVKVTAKGKRERLLCFRFPLDLDAYSLGTVGTLGADSLLTPSNTSSSSVPTLTYFTNSLGTLGAVELLSSPVSAFAVASTPEAEEEYVVDV